MPSTDRLLGAFIASTFLVVTFAGVAGGQDGQIVDDLLGEPEESEPTPEESEEPTDQPAEEAPNEPESSEDSEPAESSATEDPAAAEQTEDETQPAPAPEQESAPARQAGTAAGAPSPLRPPSTERIDPETGQTFGAFAERSAVDQDSPLWQLLALPPLLALISAAAVAVAKMNE